MKVRGKIVPQSPPHKTSKVRKNHWTINIKTITTNNECWDVPASPFYHLFWELLGPRCSHRYAPSLLSQPLWCQALLAVEPMATRQDLKVYCISISEPVGFQTWFQYVSVLGKRTQKKFSTLAMEAGYFCAWKCWARGLAISSLLQSQSRYQNPAGGFGAARVTDPVLATSHSPAPNGKELSVEIHEGYDPTWSDHIPPFLTLSIISRRFQKVIVSFCNQFCGFWITLGWFPLFSSFFLGSLCFL